MSKPAKSLVGVPAALVYLLSASFLLQGPSARAAWPGTNGRIAFFSSRSGHGDIYTINPDGTGLQRLTADPGTDDLPAWSPDGSRIAFSTYRNDVTGVYTMNADGTGRSVRLAVGQDPRWSPDGAKIAFFGRFPYGIYTMNADGSHQTFIGRGGDCGLDWSPDGANFVFATYQGPDDFGACEIWVMNVDGTNPIRLTHNFQDEWGPVWSPDGTRIAFTSERHGGPEDVWVMNADGTNPRQLTHGDIGGANPAWSPDGAKIAFDRGTDLPDGTYNEDLCEMNADGTGTLRITHALGYDGDSSWQPIH